MPLTGFPQASSFLFVVELSSFRRSQGFGLRFRSARAYARSPATALLAARSFWFTKNLVQSDRLRSNSRFGENLLATFNALCSSISKATFWARMTSPAGRRPRGMKHKPILRRPA